jgi:hypothetical protein
MIGLFCFVVAVLASPFKSKLLLEAENAVLRAPESHSEILTLRGDHEVSAFKHTRSFH